MTDLSQLRQRIDELDRELVRIVAERIAVCEDVARYKEHSDTPIIQPARVRDVVTTRRQWAIDDGVDPDFVEQLVRVLLTETHRIEVAKRRPDPAPDKAAAPSGDRSGLDTVAARIDHVVVAVDDVTVAMRSLVDRLGFHPQGLAGGDEPGIAAVSAGGVTLVLVDRTASADVAAYLEAHGSGVQHVAIEVLNAGFARASLESGAAPLLTEIVVDDHGMEQFFTAQDPATGLQLGFVARTGHRVGLSGANVKAMFAALRASES
ncbi:MAG: chorismate mutase [Ilumatobacteraceae bacterium]